MLDMFDMFQMLQNLHRIRMMTTMHDFNELPQDGKFQLKLDAVDGTLEGNLDRVPTGILQTQEDQVHDQHEDIDNNQLVHDLAPVTIPPEPEQVESRDNVERGDDRLLDSEAGHLDLLQDIIPAYHARRTFLRIRPIREHGRGDVQKQHIHPDHRQHSSQNALVAKYQMQPRVQHHRLSGDHAPPTECQQGNAQRGVGVGEELEQEAQRVREHPQTARHQQTPKVQPVPAAECAED